MLKPLHLSPHHTLLRHAFTLAFVAALFSVAPGCGGDDDDDDTGDDTSGTGDTGDTNDDGDGDGDDDDVTGDDDDVSGDDDDSTTSDDDDDDSATNDDDDDDDDGDDDDLSDASIGDQFSVTFVAPATLLLRRDGDTLIEFDAESLQLGKVRRVDDQYNYDPWWLEYDGPPPFTAVEPRGLEWLNVTEVALESETANTLTLALTYSDDSTAELTVSEVAGGRIRAKLTPKDGADKVAYFRVRPRVDAEENFYGLGTDHESPAHRGKKRAMQLEIEQGTESLYNERHVTIPLLIGTKGWGLFVDSPYPAMFDVAKKSVERVEATFGTGSASVGGITFYLYGASRAIDVLKPYYETTGYPRIPAEWAFGPWVWRDETPGQGKAEATDENNPGVMHDLFAIRDLDLATSGYWVDRPYATALNTFDFDPARYDDPQAMIDYAHAQGFRVAVWHTPYETPGAGEFYETAVAEGYFPPEYGLLLNSFGSAPIDLTNPDAFAWWKSNISIYTEMGVEGFKLDFAEDVVPGVAGNRSNKWQFFDGSDERTMHNRYQALYHRAYFENLPSTGSFIIARAGKAGGQKYVDVIWPGDLNADFARWREVMPGEKEQRVGGLPASMINGLSLGASGYPFYGADTGGYTFSPPSREVFHRWFEQTCFSTVMQVGGSDNHVAWEFARYGFDQELLDNYRYFTRLHMRLFPYVYTLAREMLGNGYPIQIPFGLAYPELNEHPDDQYLFGPDLMIAPVIEGGVSERDVMIPPGTWYDFWTGEATTVEPNKTLTITAPAPLGQPPVYVREGAMIPMLRPTIDTTAPTDDEGIESYANDPGVLYVLTYPAKIGNDTGMPAWVNFDGSSLASGYTGDDNATLQLEYTAGEKFDSGAVFEVRGVAAAPATVSIDGDDGASFDSLVKLEAAESGFFYDAAAKTLWVRLAATGGASVKF